jgi:hypothetical protein
MDENGKLEIRNAVMADRHAIAALMAALDYQGTEAFIETRLAQLLAHPDAALLVAAAGDDVVGVLSLHFLPQLALAGDIGRISYFCVDDRIRGAGACWRRAKPWRGSAAATAWRCTAIAAANGRTPSIGGKASSKCPNISPSRCVTEDCMRSPAPGNGAIVPRAVARADPLAVRCGPLARAFA